MHVLATLLGHDDLALERALETLESTIDTSSIDVGLIGEIASKAAVVKRQLALDPTDTKAPELYLALLGVIRRDNDALGAVIGGKHPSAVSEMSPLIIAMLKKKYAQQQVLAVKPAVLKKMLKQNPPTRTMKALHYRSATSMLKHESPLNLAVMARYLEPSEWNTDHAKLLEALSPSEMESRPIELVWIDKAVLAGVFDDTSQRHHFVLHAKEAGVIALVPSREQVIECFTIRTTALFMHYIQEIVHLSTYGKVLMTHADFGKRYADALIHHQDNHFQVAGYPVHWRSMHRAVASTSTNTISSPHLGEDDWNQHTANSFISSLIADKTIWHGNAMVIANYDTPVGVNIIDLAIDASRGTPLGSHSLKYARRDLEHELFARYLAHAGIQNLIIKRLGL